ncbi:hypothetical protein [Paenibacillus whitsoniae]|uniref:hypothetical protein n=1 Tax=Paenibacillus whitsoniae TaxID=2496558 RepID=UPI0019D17E79|nr:hypothetical protein [Paenibacillus whitsoniae]
MRKEKRAHLPDLPGYISEDRLPYTDFKSVESQRNNLIPEEFPEGPYGTSIAYETLGKSTPWREEQHWTRAYSYENQELHKDIPRGYPGEDDTLQSEEDL